MGFLSFFVLGVFVCMIEGVTPASLFVGMTERHLLLYALSMLSSYALGDLSFFQSTKYIGVSSALALGSTYPIFTTAFGAVFNGDIPSLLQSFALIIAVTGIVLIVKGQKEQPVKHTRKIDLFKGLSLAALAGFGWAMNAFATAQSTLGGPSLTVACGLRMGIAAFLCVFTARATSRYFGKPLPWSVTKKFLWVFVAESFIGTVVYFYGFKHSPLALGTILASLAPLILFMYEVGTGREKLSIQKLAGVIACVGGVVALSITSRGH